MELIDRFAERTLLDSVLHDVGSGQSRVLVLHGDPGVGKSALTDYVAQQAGGCRVVRAAGVESEMELAYAALHQLCAPLLHRLDHIPAPQRDALSIAFGMSAGPAPDRLVIGLAVLSLFSDAAEDRPLVCLIDDLQWLDNASAQILGFLARRLAVEPVALIMATRVIKPELAKLPSLEVGGLRDGDARALLDRAWAAPLDERVRDQLVAETRGNPLALMELPRGLADNELAGGFGMPSALRLSSRIEESFQRRTAALPEETRRLLLIAAAEPTGDPILLWRAAGQLDIGTDAAAPATEDGLVDFGTRVRFRHPLVRSAIYQSAPVQDKRTVHRALADVTDPDSEPDRRAWHRAEATAGPDEDVAEELERSADRAQARGGFAAAAAFLERATMLTLEPAQRSARALAAASAKVRAGAFDAAVHLLAVADAGPLSDLQHAHADLIRAQLAFVTNRGSDAPPLLLKAAQRLEPIDDALCRATYLEALGAAMFAARLAVGGGVLEIARAAEAAPQPATPRLADLLLDGFGAYFTGGYAAGVPPLRRAVKAARRKKSADDELRWLWLAGIAALHVWDDESWDIVSAHHIDLARAAGALTELPFALISRAVMLLFVGELSAAESLIHETETITEVTGDTVVAPRAVLGLAAFRGREGEASMLIGAITKDVIRRGEGVGLTIAEWAEAVLNNGLANYDKAMTAAQRAAEHPTDIGVSAWGTVELVEAAARNGAPDIAAGALARLCEMTRTSGTDWALGIEARSRALLAADAEPLYCEAIERLARTRLRVELARTHLLYGEWLRRQRRRTDARVQLRTAHDMFDTMGMAAFAERARRELLATGETARSRTPTTSAQLTPQEEQVARLAAAGLTNPEIGARLFISAKTVQYHLSKVFTKLGITSRSQLP
ncbi:LuxR family transcriptional regulator [Mycobacterium triplex]|uniref:LuxR family transcriptional regulator n=1 Tax=Mycobacterium triplex TaxID=47839 RepID=A0A024JUT8_9MYCO|nr:LuxR family transcriptional regulator [Mycobacterium triplex]ORW99586.1 LuxR family transcriptional regulator [Mycobacterium triplex]CDO87590.1 regulatory protein LuxR [Mycobacterium triplex]